MSHMRVVTGGVLLAAIIAGAGCNAALVGTWKTDSPAAGDGFAISTATFKDDNTYTAAAKEGDQNVRLAGTYEFNGFNLKLKTPGKPDRTYGAMVVMGNTLELNSGDKKVTMKKQ
jgi:hypothetical protein